MKQEKILSPLNSYERRFKDTHKLLSFTKKQQWSFEYLQILQNIIDTNKEYQCDMDAVASVFAESVNLLLPKVKIKRDALQTSLILTTDFDHEKFEQARITQNGKFNRKPLPTRRHTMKHESPDTDPIDVELCPVCHIKGPRSEVLTPESPGNPSYCPWNGCLLPWSLAASESVQALADNKSPTNSP